MTNQTLLWLLLAFPLASFLLIVLLTNKNKALSHTVAVGAALLNFVVAMTLVFRALKFDLHHLAETPFSSVINWLPLGEGFFTIGLRLDPLSTFTLFFVGWTVQMIFRYSVGYHN